MGYPRLFRFVLTVQRWLFGVNIYFESVISFKFYNLQFIKLRTILFLKWMCYIHAYLHFVSIILCLSFCFWFVITSWIVENWIKYIYNLICTIDFLTHCNHNISSSEKCNIKPSRESDDSNFWHRSKLKRVTPILLVCS